MSGARPMHLRVAHVWRDEVMADHVALPRVRRGVPRPPAPITIGPHAGATFTTPDFSLPDRFAVLRPGARGWVLTLGAGMGGTIRLDGQEHDVAEFVARGGGERAEGTAGAFRATPVKPGDWGVIQLDRDGDHVLFFQFVPAEAPLPPEPWRDWDLLAPALAFAFALHAIALGVMFWFHEDRHSMMWPGDAQLAASYLVERPEPPAPIEEVKSGAEDGDEDAEPASTVGESGKSGGEGDKPRARAPDPDVGSAEDPIVAKVQNTGLLRQRKTFESVAARGGFDRRLGNAMARIQGPRNDGGPGGYGPGKGTGVGPGEGTGTTRGGDGKGPGGGGTAQGDVVTQGVIKTGGKRPPRGAAGGTGIKEAQVKIQTGTPAGDLGGLTADQINKVVMSRKNAIRACYERQLQRNPRLAGKIVITWKIDSGGRVSSARVKSTSMRNGAVEDCVVRQVQSMKFPSPRGSALVNYPFIFAER